MATKLNNRHLVKLLNSKSYNIVDTYIILCHLSSEVKGKFLIQSTDDKKCTLANIIRKHISSISYKTIYNQIVELINIGILEFNSEVSAWILVDMEKMTIAKSSIENITEKEAYSGYTHIREFFLTHEFHSMKAIEKRCLIYMAHLSDSKASKSYSDFVMNLCKSHSRWLLVLKTKSKYYARLIIETMLAKYQNLFINKSDVLRSKELAPKSITNFKFLFSCNIIGKIQDDTSQCELVKLYNKKEWELVKERCNQGSITLSKKQIMHIVRAISTIREWFIKERIVQLIINKYIAIQIHKSRENIKSLPAYLVTLAREIIKDYKNLKEHLQSIHNDYQSIPTLEKIDNINIDSILTTL